jgi:hypothetical protein
VALLKQFPYDSLPQGAHGKYKKHSLAWHALKVVAHDDRGRDTQTPHRCQHACAGQGNFTSCHASIHQGHAGLHLCNCGAVKESASFFGFFDFFFARDVPV